MPGLSVTEKEHWKNRIANRIDKKIEAIFAEEPNLLDRIKKESRTEALKSLGLAELQGERDAIEAQEKALSERETQVERAMLAKVRGVPVETIVETYYGSRYETEIESAVQRRQCVLEDKLLAATDPGQRIVQLRLERDNVLDTVWLATSSAQVRELWSKVGEILNDEATPLQRQALTIPPAQNE